MTAHSRVEGEGGNERGIRGGTDGGWRWSGRDGGKGKEKGKAKGIAKGKEEGEGMRWERRRARLPPNAVGLYRKTSTYQVICSAVRGHEKMTECGAGREVESGKGNVD